MSSEKKLGRRISGTYGRLGTRKLKRAASKGTRKKMKDDLSLKEREVKNG
jgi:hypothetical protein